MKATKAPNPKKEIKKDLIGKIESAIPELKKTLGEKKFQSRIKKAAKMLMHGLHEKDFSTSSKTAVTKTKDASNSAMPVKKLKAKKAPKQQQAN